MHGERGESRFVSNTAALVFQTVAATLLTLLQVKLLSNVLSKETFGLFASLRGFSLVLSTLAAHGLPQLLVRFLPVHESGRDRGSAVRLVAASLLLAGGGLVVVAAAAHAAGKWTFEFVPRGLLTGEFYLWFYATTVGVMLKLVLYGGLNGLRRLAFQVLLETLSLLGVLVWFFIERDGLTLAVLFRALGVVNLVTAAGGFVVFFGYLERSSGGGADAPRGAGRESLRDGYGRYLVWAAGLSLVALAFSDADRYLLAQVLTLELLAAFHIGARVGRLANRLLGVANLAFQPEVTRLDAEGREGRVVQSTRIFLKFHSIFAFSMAAFIVVFARELIVLVSSEEYTTAVPLLVLLALSLPLTTMTAPVTTVMKAIDQVRGALWCDLVWALCYVALIVLLAPRLGLVGVGIAQIVACASQLFVALKLSKLPIGAGDVGRLSARLALAAGAAFLPAVAYGLFAGTSRFWATFGIKAVLFAGGAVAFRALLRAWIVFDGDERSVLRTMLEDRRLRALGRWVGV